MNSRKVSFDSLFNSKEAQAVSKIRDETSVPDILRRPIGVDIGSEKHVLRIEPLRFHGINQTADFVMIILYSVSLSKWSDDEYSEVEGSYRGTIVVASVSIIKSAYVLQSRG